MRPLKPKDGDPRGADHLALFRPCMARRFISPSASIGIADISNLDYGDAVPIKRR